MVLVLLSQREIRLRGGDLVAKPLERLAQRRTSCGLLQTPRRFSGDFEDSTAWDYLSTLSSAWDDLSTLSMAWEDLSTLSSVWDDLSTLSTAWDGCLISNDVRHKIQYLRIPEH